MPLSLLTNTNQWCEIKLTWITNYHRLNNSIMLMKLTFSKHKTWKLILNLLLLSLNILSVAMEIKWFTSNPSFQISLNQSNHLRQKWTLCKCLLHKIWLNLYLSIPTNSLNWSRATHKCNTISMLSMHPLVQHKD